MNQSCITGLSPSGYCGAAALRAKQEAEKNEPPVRRTKPEPHNPYLIDARELIRLLNEKVKTERSTIEIKAKLIPLVESLAGLPSQAGESCCYAEEPEGGEGNG